MYHVCSHGNVIESVVEENGIEIRGFKVGSDESGSILISLNQISPSELCMPSIH
jgi:hypothetical protein